MARGLIWGVRALLAIALVFALASMNPGRIADQLSWHYALGIALAQIPFFVGIFVQGWRHAFLINDVRATRLLAFKAMLIAAGLNYLVPGQAAEITKASYISARSGLPMDVGVSATLLGRLLDLVAVSVGGMIAGLVLGGAANQGVLAGLTVLLLGLVAALPFLLGGIRMVADRVGWARGASFLGRVAGIVRHQISPGRFVGALGLSMLAWALFGLGIGIFLAMSTDVSLGGAEITLLVAALAFGAAVPIFPGALGTYEGAGVLAMLQFGLTPEAAAVAAIGIRICNIIVILPIGLFLAHREGVGLGRLLSRRSGA